MVIIIFIILLLSANNNNHARLSFRTLTNDTERRVMDCFWRWRWWCWCLLVWRWRWWRWCLLVWRWRWCRRLIARAARFLVAREREIILTGLQDLARIGFAHIAFFGIVSGTRLGLDALPGEALTVRERRVVIGLALALRERHGVTPAVPHRCRVTRRNASRALSHKRGAE
jgi:hypothetical protein